MAGLTPLLELQDLDLAGDRLAERRRTLPERAALAALEAAGVPLAQSHAALCERMAELKRAEHALEHEVEGLVARAKEVETTLYSGTVRHSKELTALQVELQSHRDRQAGIETKELALLEEIDQVESELARNRADDERRIREAMACTDLLRVAERAIDAELDGLAAARRMQFEGLPRATLATYEKLRLRAPLGGRAVARLESGGCSGCHMRLPVLEHSRMQAQPADALLSCSHCSRILVRSGELGS